MAESGTGPGGGFPLADMILEGLPTPVVLLNDRRVVVAANRAARDLLGGKPVGRNLSLVLRHPLVLEVVDLVINNGGRQTVDITLPVPVQRDFAVQAAAVEDAPDEEDAAKAVVVFHDTTIARRAEQMRADFVANVSHELRSPLSALVGIVETLRNAAANDPAAQARFLEIMEREAGRMTRLVDDLLSLSRVEINEHVPPSARVDLAGLLKGVAEVLKGRAAKRGQTIRLEGLNALPEVMGDNDQLTQVFQNLIDNSIKYAAENTVIEVSALGIEKMPTSGRPGVGIVVADNGEGISPEDLPRVTERFYRVDKARSRSAGGTGLGLAIVKHIVNRHRGRLTIASSRGEGTTVTVILPVSHKTVTHTS